MSQRYLFFVIAVTFFLSGCAPPTCEIIVENQSGRTVQLFEATEDFGNSLTVKSIPDGVSRQFERLLRIEINKPLGFKVVFADQSEVESQSPSGNTPQTRYRFTIGENGNVRSASSFQ